MNTKTSQFAGAQPERPIGQIESELQSTSLRITALNTAIESLEVRLGSVLRPQSPATQQEGKGLPRVQLVDTAEVIRLHGDAVMAAGSRIADILSRCEL